MALTARIAARIAARRGRIVARVLLLLTALAVAASAGDWPQWRGPGRDGVWSEPGTLEAIPPGGLRVLWRVPVGVGFSTPVVAQGRVYLTDADLVRPRARERVHSFEEGTGKTLWTHAYDVSYPDWAFDEKSPRGPWPTPIVAGGRLYTLGSVGHLFCFDALTGEVLWTKDLSKEYPGKELQCSASLLIDGDHLILFVGAKPDATVIAFDRKSGKEAWRALDEGATHSSPIVVTAGRARQLILWTEASVTSLDPATGTLLWRQRLNTTTDYVVSTPVVRNDLLLIGGLMMRLDPDKTSASVLWPESRAVSRRVLSNTSTAAFLGDHVFSARSSGELVCIEARTGKEVWQTDKVTELKNGASIHITPNGDSAWLYNERGELIRARLSPEGYKELGRFALLAPTYPFGGRKCAWAPPAFANRHVFARSDKELVCASLAKEP